MAATLLSVDRTWQNGGLCFCHWSYITSMAVKRSIGEKHQSLVLCLSRARWWGQRGRLDVKEESRGVDGWHGGGAGGFCAWRSSLSIDPVRNYLVYNWRKHLFTFFVGNLSWTHQQWIMESAYLVSDDLTEMGLSSFCSHVGRHSAAISGFDLMMSITNQITNDHFFLSDFKDILLKHRKEWLWGFPYLRFEILTQE